MTDTVRNCFHDLGFDDSGIHEIEEQIGNHKVVVLPLKTASSRRTSSASLGVRVLRSQPRIHREDY